MLQSHFLSDKLTTPFPLDNNWALKKASKMNDQAHRHSSPFPALPTRASSFESVEGDIDALEIVTPRSYSHSPAPIPPPSSGTDSVELQPWLFQLFPESYADASSYTLSDPSEGQYLQGPDGTLIYQSPMTVSRSMVGGPILHTSAEDGIYSSAGWFPIPSFLLPNPKYLPRLLYSAILAHSREGCFSGGGVA